MSKMEPNLWTNLESARPHGENLAAHAAIPDITDRVLCALDAEGARHVLVSLNPEEKELEDKQSRGFTVITRELRIHGSNMPGKYIDIASRDSSGYKALDLICEEIAAGFIEGRRSPDENVRQVLSKWRRFWGQIPQELLTREQLMGLFAELWFFSFWLFPRTGMIAVERWRGPFGARHDFEWPGRSIEVKSTRSKRGHIQRINGLDQLLPPENGDLLFFSMVLSEEAGANNNLPLIVAACREKLEADADAISRFEVALSHVGYSSLQEREYESLRIRVVDQALFAVRDDFPRLTPDAFQGGTPSGVERVEYEVNLNAFHHLCIARSPEENISL